jgi:hypothetical protein
MFIELTISKSENKKILINTNHIVTISPTNRLSETRTNILSETRTVIDVTSFEEDVSDRYTVEESYEDIKRELDIARKIL